MVTCRTYTIEKAPTPGFTLTADQYEGIGSFNTTLHISYPVGAGQIVRIVNSDPISGDSCLTTDISLDGNGNATVPYSVIDTHTIYVIKKTGTGGENCCTSFSQTLCQYSNYITFTVTDNGNIQFLSNPSGAEIWLALTGQTLTDTTQVTPDTILNVPVGDYDYTLKLTNYNDYISTQPITVIKDQTTIVGPINLVLAEGCIYFSSSPQGARIYLAPVGQIPVDTGLNTPNTICGKPLGDYIYKLTLSGYEDATGTVTLTSGHGETVSKTLIELPILTDIIISPLNPSISVNTDQQFSAIPLDQYGNPYPATVVWNSSNTYVGIIDPDTGMFSALHTGTSIITASSSSVTRTTTVTVTPLVPILTTITVSPATISIVANNATIFTAITLDQLGNPISMTVTWSSSDINIGTINQNGVFLALSQGTTIITASSGTVSGIAVANVTPAVPVEIPILTKITISPLTTSVAVGIGTIFVATTLDQFDNPIYATVTWSSSDTNIGTINQNGVFIAISPGITTITASSGNIVGVALANVIPAIPTEQPTLSKIVITPSTETILVDTGTVFVASTLDQFGNSIVAPVTWDSSDPDVGTIDQYGIFSALHIGKTTITASGGDIVGVALVNVVKTLPGQATGGILGNINSAALILGTAMIGAVIMTKPPQPPQIRIIERSHT